MKIPYDIIGDIAILKFPREIKITGKKKFANKFLKQHKNIKTALEKIDKIKGRLRIAKTSFLAGENKKQTVHKENNCLFKININETYFSPRLSNERKIIASEIAKKATKTKNKILVMFAGIAPFPIIIAKTLKQAGKTAEIISSEINRKANKLAKENVELNKLQDYIKIVQGDSKKLPGKLKGKFDFIIMPRPNLKETFLDAALKFSKNGTKVYYYGFGTREKVLGEIKAFIGEKSNRARKISTIKIRKAGEIAPYKFRWVAEFSVRLKSYN